MNIHKSAQSNPSIEYPIDYQADKATVIKVIGLGGAGSNAVDRMIQFGIDGVDFLAANTDRQALSENEAPTKLLLGKQFTNGHGAGGDPQIGETAAYESLSDLSESIEDADILFITCGMGGGTGTGAAPVVAELARDLDIITVAVVTMPFNFEGTYRYHNAMQGITVLQSHCDTLITVPNERLLQIVPKDVTLDVAFRMADDILRQGIQSITEVVLKTGLINVDFADIRELLHQSGGAVLAIGHGKGTNATITAVRSALHHPLQDISGMNYATGLLVHFTGGYSLPMNEIERAVEEIRTALGPNSQLTLGVTVEEQLHERVQIIILATGVGGHSLENVIGEIPFRHSFDTTNSKIVNLETKNTAETGSDDNDPSRNSQESFPYSPSPYNLDTPAFLRRQRIRDSIEHRKI